MFTIKKPCPLLVIVSLLVASCQLAPKSRGPSGSQGPICTGSEYRSVYVVRFTSLHSGIVVPTSILNLGPVFSEYSHVAFNWGDLGFYKAGYSEWSQKLAAPKAILWPTEAVVYIEPVLFSEEDVEHFRTSENCNLLSCGRNVLTEKKIQSRYDFIEVRVNQTQMDILSQQLNRLIKRDDNGQVAEIIMPNAVNSDAYPRHSRFFPSSKKYFGLFGTCNSMVNESLTFLEEFNNFKSYLPNTLFDEVEKRIKNVPESCVKIQRRN